MSNVEAIKKALEGVTHAPGVWLSEGTAVYCDDATGQRVADTKGQYLFWSEDQKKASAAYIAAVNPVAISELLTTLEALQRENEQLRKDRYDMAYAITGGEDAPGLLDSIPASHLVKIAKDTHVSHSAEIDRSVKAEAEVKRLQAEIDRKSSMPGDHRYWEGRYRDEAAENERLREALEALLAAHNIKTVRGALLDNVIASATARARQALASAGEEHHAE